MSSWRISRRGLLLSVMAIAIAVVPPPTAPAVPVDRHFRIEASSFQYTPGIIDVNPGDHVTLDLVSTDVVHGLYLDGYGLNVTADPGQTASLSFVADRSGVFRFRCSVTCGALHPFMSGKLNVGANELFYRALGLAVLALVAGVWSVRPKGQRA